MSGVLFKSRIPGSHSRAFSLLELLLAVALVGIVLTAFVAFSGGMARLGHQASDQGRRAGWRSFQDQVLVAGHSPLESGSYDPQSNPAIPGLKPAGVESEGQTASPGRVTVRFLRRSTSDGSEPQGLGLVLGPGTQLAAPEPNSVVVTLGLVPEPSLVPGDGSLLPIVSMERDGGGAFQSIVATASSSVLVKLRVSSGEEAEGLGEARLRVSAGELLRGLQGRVWAEYAGNPAAGDRSVALADGRTEWIVAQGSGFRRWVPSAVRNFGYTLDLGNPLLQVGARDYASGESPGMDLVLARSVWERRVPMFLHWPKDLVTALGVDASLLANSFGGVAGGMSVPASGNLAGFFDPGLDTLWAKGIVISAEARLGAEASVARGFWRVSRVPLTLPPPETLESLDLNADPLSSGSVHVIAGLLPELGRVGRLSAQGGLLVSSGPELTLEFVP